MSRLLALVLTVLAAAVVALLVWYVATASPVNPAVVVALGGVIVPIATQAIVTMVKRGDGT